MRPSAWPSPRRPGRTSAPSSFMRATFGPGARRRTRPMLMVLEAEVWRTRGDATPCAGGAGVGHTLRPPQVPGEEDLSDAVVDLGNRVGEVLPLEPESTPSSVRAGAIRVRGGPSAKSASISVQLVGEEGEVATLANSSSSSSRRAAPASPPRNARHTPRSSRSATTARRGPSSWRPAPRRAVAVSMLSPTRQA